MAALSGDERLAASGDVSRARSAVIDASARIASDVEIGHGVVIEAGVEVGSGTKLLVGTVLRSGTSLGRRCVVGPYAVIGGEPMDSAFHGEASRVEIADDVTIREFATVHRATGAAKVTSIGERTLVMSYVHVSHNTTVGHDVVLTAGAQLGGHSVVEEHAFIGAGSAMHQFCRVGRYAMFGAASAVNQDVLPFATARGNPAKHLRLNRVGLQRAGFSKERYEAIERALRFLRRRDMRAVEELAVNSEDVAHIVEFIADSRRGYARFTGSGE